MYDATDSLCLFDVTAADREGFDINTNATVSSNGTVALGHLEHFNTTILRMFERSILNGSVELYIPETGTTETWTYQIVTRIYNTDAIANPCPYGADDPNANIGGCDDMLRTMDVRFTPATPGDSVVEMLGLSLGSPSAGCGTEAVREVYSTEGETVSMCVIASFAGVAEAAGWLSALSLILLAGGVAILRSRRAH